MTKTERHAHWREIIEGQQTSGMSIVVWRRANQVPTTSFYTIRRRLKEREGVNIPRATQSSWLMQTYESIRPLEAAFRQAIFESDVLFTDDTPLPLQDKGNGKLKKEGIIEVGCLSSCTA